MEHFECNYQTKQDAFRLFKDVDNFDFIVNLIIVYKVFDVTLDATILLQSKKNDIADGLEVISSLINLVKQYRRSRYQTCRMVWRGSFHG